MSEELEKRLQEIVDEEYGTDEGFVRVVAIRFAEEFGYAVVRKYQKRFHGSANIYEWIKKELS